MQCTSIIHSGYGQSRGRWIAYLLELVQCTTVNSNKQQWATTIAAVESLTCNGVDGARWSTVVTTLPNGIVGAKLQQESLIVTEMASKHQQKYKKQWNQYFSGYILLQISPWRAQIRSHWADPWSEVHVRANRCDSRSDHNQMTIRLLADQTGNFEYNGKWWN